MKPNYSEKLFFISLIFETRLVFFGNGASIAVKKLVVFKVNRAEVLFGGFLIAHKLEYDAYRTLISWHL